MQGTPDQTRAQLLKLIDVAPDAPGALYALAQMLLPGPIDSEVLRQMHSRLRPDVYLEVGVEGGRSLQLAVHSRVVIGIDPEFQNMPPNLPSGTQFFQMTSDEFFQTRTREEVLDDARVDMAFIDGLHLFEHVLRDFGHIERWCRPGSIIVLHDCLAPHPAATLRERQTRFWVGDAWKALEYLLAHRPDLHIRVIPCYPSGLAVVQFGGAKAEGGTHLDRFCAEYLSAPYPYAGGQWPHYYPFVDNSERGVTELLNTLVARQQEHVVG